tara:strand:- start:2230 stop:2685 length:456 start_codon:yes stop_codon:yes gene_type:complete
MKKQVTIANAALNFLHRVLTETGVTSKVDARKQAAVFRCMSPFVTSHTSRLEEIRVEMREEETMPNGTKRFIIAEPKRKEFEERMLAVENEQVKVDFDVESLAVLKRAFENLFTKQAALVEKGEGGGISNETTMKLIEQADDALEAAVDVE